jgi:hypothetical protein
MSEENSKADINSVTLNRNDNSGLCVETRTCDERPTAILNFADLAYEWFSQRIVGFPADGVPRLGVNYMGNTAPNDVILVEQVIASLDCKTTESARVHANELFKSLGAALMGYEPPDTLMVWSGNYIPKSLNAALVRIGHDYVLHLPAEGARNLSKLNQHGQMNLEERHLLLVEGNGHAFKREVNILADIAGEIRIPNSINSPYHNKIRRAAPVFCGDVDFINLPPTGSIDRRIFPSRFLDNGWDYADYTKFRHEVLHPLQLQKFAAYLLAKAHEAYEDGINISVAKNLIKEWRYYHDVVQRFYSEMCEVVSGAYIRNTELFRFFEAYCEFKGYRYLGTLSSNI